MAKGVVSVSDITEKTKEDKSLEKMKNICVGLLAHVDAGKTTLSEGLLFTNGNIKKMGRVDNKDAFLDTYSLERERGITIFSKQALIKRDDVCITLLDTPGHVDFSAEMERTLQVLDYAILVINGADGVQGHTKTLWKLLERYEIPTFLFVNKMDQVGTDKERLLWELREILSKKIIDFTSDEELLKENIATCDDELLERYFEEGEVSDNDIISLIATRKMYPCFFGSALKLEGIRELLDAICKYSLKKNYNDDFGARVFKITRDSQNNRLTHMKITGGVLNVKDTIGENKVNQIRIYSGTKYESVKQVTPGMVCAVTGLTDTRAGMSLGQEKDMEKPYLQAVLNYQIILPDGCNVNDMLIKFKQLEEEEPELQIEWNEELKEIHAKLMGEIQIEILRSLIKERFGIDVKFGAGNIVYKETIADTVESVGHFEPLRHYAEVHLLMEPLPEGSGLVFDAECSTDRLDKNWQRLIMTHLMEKSHKGVLIGAEITDMKITLVAGRAHQKHTEGGDFRQATYRAVRQGLREAKSVLLEPYYDFTLEIPAEMVGRAISDIDRMYGRFESPETLSGTAVINGSCPVSTMRDYHMEVISYTRGQGKLTCTFKGYGQCHNSEDVIESVGYNAEADVDNPTGSVFCAHGSGFNVPWNEVKNYMHVESVFDENEEEIPDVTSWDVEASAKRYAGSAKEERELEEIFARTYGGIKDVHNIFHTNMSNEALKEKKRVMKKTITAKQDKPYVYKPTKKQEEYFVVDGYNIVFAWDELKELAALNIDSARDRLIDIMSAYQGIRNCKLIIVFDAYKLKGHTGEQYTYNNVEVVFTKEDQTADTYIEQLAHKIGRKYNVTVATSDGLEQVTVLSQGCRIMSATELKTEIDYCNENMKKKMAVSRSDKKYLLDDVGDDVKEFINRLE